MTWHFDPTPSSNKDLWGYGYAHSEEEAGALKGLAAEIIIDPECRPGSLYLSNSRNAQAMINADQRWRRWG